MYTQSNPVTARSKPLILQTLTQETQPPLTHDVLTLVPPTPQVFGPEHHRPPDVHQQVREKDDHSHDMKTHLETGRDGPTCSYFLTV